MPRRNKKKSSHIETVGKGAKASCQNPHSSQRKQCHSASNNDSNTIIPAVLPHKYMAQKERSSNLNRRTVFSHGKVRIYFSSSNAYFIGNSEVGQDLIVVEHQDFNRKILKKSLEVGDFKNDLVCGEVLYERFDYRTFNLHVVSEARKVSLVFPSGASVATCNTFDCILSDILQSENKTEIPERHNDVSNELVKYGFHRPDIEHCSDSKFHTEIAYINPTDMIKDGLECGAREVSKAMDWVTPILIGNIRPQPNETQVDPTVQVGLKVTRFAAEGAAKASEILGNQVGALASYAGRSLSPHIQRLGTEFLTENYDYSREEAATSVRNALEVTAEVAEGISTVFGGIVNAMKIIGSSFTENTVKVVKHTYGEDAGEAVDDVLHTVGNIGAARLNSQLYKKKGIALQTARKIAPSPPRYLSDD